MTNPLDDLLTSGQVAGVFNVGTQPRRWPIVVARFGRFAAAVRLAGMAGSLGVDVLAFVDGDRARASVYGIDNGARYPAFNTDAPGRSDGLPAVALVATL